MSHEPGPVTRAISPALSGRASPNLRAGRKVEEAAAQKGDKNQRRYALGIEKALSTFEPSQQEWADYIAFLARLSKAIQGVKETEVIPHSALVSLRLAQCLNPSLPSGVHQKALEVYSNIFELLKSSNLGRDLQVYLPGLLPVLSFASLTVRPLYYCIFEEHILKLDCISLRPALKSVILSLLPGIEDETSEDFERGIAILDKLRQLPTSELSDNASFSEKSSWEGHYWQCLFLAVMTSESRRQGALAYLNRRLPSFNTPNTNGPKTNGHSSQEKLSRWPTSEAEIIIRPEPGLLIRCFAAGLHDPNILVQRGFLDLLVTHVPLNSELLQQTIHSKDLDLLVGAAVTVVLRRDMSLNRRLWAWFLGPESATADGDAEIKTPGSELGDPMFSKQANYFQKSGAASLQRCLLSMFSLTVSDASEKAKPFRISSALMDRWEIGGYLIPFVLVPGLMAAFEYSRSSDRKSGDEVVKSASLFFDGIESNLIWAQIIDQLSAAIDTIVSNPTQSEQSLRFLLFVVTKFNIREEDMLTNHIPKTVLVSLHGLTNMSQVIPAASENALSTLLEFIQYLVSVIPEHIGEDHSSKADTNEFPKLQKDCTHAVSVIKENSRNIDHVMLSPSGPNISAHIASFLLYTAGNLFIRSLQDTVLRQHVGKVVNIQISLMYQLHGWSGLDLATLYETITTCLQGMTPVWRSAKSDFAVALSIASLWTTLAENKGLTNNCEKTKKLCIESELINYFWLHLAVATPSHHVEAVRMLWRLQRISVGDNDRIDLSIFVSERLVDTSSQLEDFGRMMTLWEHTVQHQQSKSERKPSIYARRTSSHSSPLDIDHSEAEAVLSKPLMILLDTLAAGASDSSAVIAAWLRNLPSLSRVISALLSRLESGFDSLGSNQKYVASAKRRNRLDRRSIQMIAECLDRLIELLSNGSPYTWKVLADVHSLTDSEEKTSLTGIRFLANFVTKMMGSVDCAVYEALQRRLLRLLHIMFTSESAISLRDLHLEVPLIQLLRQAIQRSQASVQIEFLRLLSCSLKVKESTEEPEDAQNLTPNDNFLKVNDPRLRLQTEVSHVPPLGLFDCIKEALKAPSSRQYLEYWMNFLSDILPLYSQAIFSAMIPLVECFCAQINLTFDNMKSMAQRSIAPEKQVPTTPLLWLLHGLELVLANAHGSLITPDAEPPLSARLSPSAQGFFGGHPNVAMTPMGDPNKTAKSNSRLTVILCVHDAVETCFRMWSWASYGSDAGDIEYSSAASTSFNAQKVRSRTKKMLEHLFAAEGLESVETLASLWTQARNNARSDVTVDDIFSLMNVLSACRPRNATPLILNALYSRTNVDALDLSRRSTLTCDLTASDVAEFLLKYVSTIEDDALDEIWADCSTFLRDVLSNPMPHRQVLPAFLQLTALLAEKIDNTNFGERQRIHRELADLFSRLLTATFTVRPNAGMYENAASSKIGSRPSDQAGDLVTSLLAVTPKLQNVLEANDRVTAAINSITTHAISPSFHAKTFPENVRPEILQLMVLIAAQSPDGKLWRKEMGDAFSDARIFAAKPDRMSSDWFPALRKWSSTEKTVVVDTLSRIVAPSAAALMFGVGANSARLAADRTAQHNLRRTALLLLANEQDGLSSSVPSIDSKTAELCTATAVSAPSCATRADIFMAWRALFLSTRHVHMAGMWPTINATLQAALLSVCPDGAEQDTYNNLSLLQACKFLDLLATIQPDEFQLQEWVFLTNTIDAVYTSVRQSSALVDEVAEALTLSGADNGEKAGTESQIAAMDQGRSGTRKPMLAKLGMDMADMKAMAREEFVRQILLPFFSRLSMAAYEGTYQMGRVDLKACRADLVDDLMDEGTVV
ncbi:hypothetical protein K461DRAFT_292251 [Myriangium duriaei CBS 260.36]|uniref:Dopey N-terminal domain-containing protein n=1 Tax=Myriangium duriaei CBS 260.36 TaxID=1168546 RepID=A0A9P4MMN4_9PEZI|nr:hypothetical protein K461DRAFT_292251 [Myriangium duriaei CBS 260.36]